MKKKQAKVRPRDPYQEDYEKQAAQHSWLAQLERDPVIPSEVEAAWLEVKAAWPREARAWPPREARAWLREVGAWLLDLAAWLEVPFNNAAPERWERRKRYRASLDAARRITGMPGDTPSLRYMGFAYQMVAQVIRGRADLRYYSHATGGGKGAYLMLEAESGTKALVRPVPNAGEVDTSEIMRDVKDQLAVLSADVGTDRVLLITEGELPGSLRGIIESHPSVEAVSIRDGSDGWKLILSIDKVLGLPR